MQFLSDHMIVGGFRPVDMSTAANDGDWVSIRNYRHVSVVLWGAIGTAGQDPTLTIEQATDVAGTGAKALNFTEIFTKQAATDLLSTGQWTRVTQAAANTYTHADAAEQEKIWVVEFDAEDFDVSGGFTAIRGRVADVGAAAQLGALFYVLSGPAHHTAPQRMLSAIVD